MENLGICKCGCDYPYLDNNIIVCPLCGNEWMQSDISEANVIIKDSVGNVLADGDSVTVIKDLKVKGSSSSIKIGTKVKNIKLILETSDDHNIDCKIDGFGKMLLKSSVVKKA